MENTTDKLTDKRHLVQIPSEQVKKLMEIDKLRADLTGYPLSRKVHALLQEKLSEIFQSKSWFPHNDGVSKESWFEYVRELIPTHVFAPIAIGVVTKSQQMTSCAFTRILVTNQHDRTWWCNYKEDILNQGTFLLTNLKNKEFSKEYYAQYEKTIKELLKMCDAARKSDFTTLTIPKLLEAYNETYKQILCFYGLVWDIESIDICLEEKMKKKLEELMKQKNLVYTLSEFSVKYGVLTTPLEMSYVNREQLETYKIANSIQKNEKLRALFSMDPEIIEKEIKENYPEIKEKINRLVKEYWWTSLGWSTRTEKDFIKFIKEIKTILKENPSVQEEIGRMEKLPEKVKKQKEDLAKELNFDGEMIYLLDVFEKYAAFHDWRKEGQMKTTNIFNKFLSELSERTSTKYDDLVWCWPSEIQQLMQGRTIDFETVQKRKESFFCLVTEEGVEQYTGETAIKKRKNELMADVKNVVDFRGINASRGKVIGIAKVCFSAKDALQKMNKGDILVASMTLPDYVPAMQKASAIVTDEGGVTCHAAIISRELKIPCIVGTKIATRSVCDGDVIEVNCNHGIVKILEKKK